MQLQYKKKKKKRRKNTKTDHNTEKYITLDKAVSRMLSPVVVIDTKHNINNKVYAAAINKSNQNKGQGGEKTG